MFFSLSIHLPFFFLSFSLPVIGLSSKTSIPTSDPDQRRHSWHQRYAACSWSTQTTYATSAAIFGSEVATAGIDLAQLAAGPQGRRQHHRSDSSPPSLVRPIAPIPRPDGSGPAHQAGQVLLTARKFQQYGDQREGYALPPPPGLKIRQEFVPQVQERLLQLAVRARAEASEQNRPMPDIIQFSVDRNFFTSA